MPAPSAWVCHPSGLMQRDVQESRRDWVLSDRWFVGCSRVGRRYGCRCSWSAKVRVGAACLLALGAGAALGFRVLGQGTFPMALQLAPTARVWIWVTPVDESLLVFVLSSKDKVDGPPGTLPSRRPPLISHLSFADLLCYRAATDLMFPYPGFHFWSIDFAFPDTMLHVDPSAPGRSFHQTRGVRVPGRNIRAVHVGVPLWILCVIFGAYPTVMFLRGPVRRWNRRRRGRCARCGYDLSGNESGVCPECGSPVDDRRQPAKLPDP